GPARNGQPGCARRAPIPARYREYAGPAPALGAEGKGCEDDALRPSPLNAHEGCRAAAPTAGGKIEINRAVATRLPERIGGEQRRQSCAAPREGELEELGIASAEQRAKAVNRDPYEQRQEILAHQEDLHGAYHVQDQRGVRDTPTHRWTGGTQE